MPRLLRGGARLSCFYCGKQSALRFRPGLDRFDCANCDATNFLDRNGDITDPPVATEKVAPRNAPRATKIPRGAAMPPPLATPKTTTTTPTTGTPSKSLFCNKCLKNQHLFTASLAQYYSDETDQSDSERLDSDYYKFRRGLEKRYPQVCDNCADRVGKAIEKAGYTAKTDHLRKMMDRSRQQRSVRKATTTLDWVAAALRGLWWAGLVLQMVWHARVVLEILSRPGEDASGMSDPDDEGVVSFAQLQSVVDFLQGWEWLRYSLVATVPGCLWNPHLVSWVRGFSRHLHGLWQWYSFQGIILGLRFSFYHFMPEFPDPKLRDAMLSAHVAIVGLMSLLYLFASRSIRVDTTPLFRVHESTITPNGKTAGKGSQSPTDPDQALWEDPNSLDNLLDEALHSLGSDRHGALDLESDSLSTSGEPDFHPQRPLPRTKRATEQSTFSGTPQRKASVDDAMDWTPTGQTELPRAFREPASGRGRAFGEAPTNDESRPFWYSLPEAPLNPARRMRNPPTQGSLRINPSPNERGENIFFRSSRGGQNDGGQKESGTRQNGGVAFRQPQFFANTRGSEETDALADQFGGSFTMSQEEEDGEAGRARSSAAEGSTLRTRFPFWRRGP